MNRVNAIGVFKERTNGEEIYINDHYKCNMWYNARNAVISSVELKY
jgi:hypothetical protein